MTVSDAVLKALSGKDWLTEFELGLYVLGDTGRLISGSNATARIRELRKKGHNVQCRHLHDRRWEYKVETARSR